MTTPCTAAIFARQWRILRWGELRPFVVIWAIAATGWAADSAGKKSFDIPATEAVIALEQFSAQSGAQVIFPEEAIEGAQTNALKGAFTPAEAIDRLLAGTNLQAAQDRQSGSFAVSRVTHPRRETADPNG